MIRSIVWLKIKIQRWHSDIVIYILSYIVSYYIIYIVICGFYQQMFIIGWNLESKFTTAISFSVESWKLFVKVSSTEFLFLTLNSPMMMVQLLGQTLGLISGQLIRINSSLSIKRLIKMNHQSRTVKTCSIQHVMRKYKDILWYILRHIS